MDGCKSFLKKSPDADEIANSGHWYTVLQLCSLSIAFIVVMPQDTGDAE